MKVDYWIYRVSINKKFKRTQEITWEEQKRILFEIMLDLSKNNLFDVKKKSNPKYNLVQLPGRDSSHSLCLISLNKKNDLLIKSILVDAHLKKVEDLNEKNILHNSNKYSFILGKIEHKDLELFRNGIIESIFKFFHEENSGLLLKTYFSIYVDDSSQKIFLVKQSGTGTLGLGSLEHYLREKSLTFKSTVNENTIKFVHLPVDEEFNPKDVDNLNVMTLSVKKELVEEYKRKSGKKDAFMNIY